MALSILVVVGSVRRDRIGIRPARYLQQCCISRGHEATLVDPLESGLPLLDRMYKEYPAGQAPEALERLAELIKSCHAVIVVAGEYNHSIQPALSNLLDHFLEEWFWRPAGIACYSAGQYRGRARGDATAGTAAGDRDAEHPVHPGAAKGPGPVR